MKRFFSGLLIAGMVLACAPPAFAKDGITVNVDADELTFDVAPQIINDRLMVPMRAIFEKLDAEVDYIAEEKAVVSRKGDKVIRFVINSDYMEIAEGGSDARKVELDAPATIIDGRTLVPLRAVAESFGYDVQWYGDTKTVQIITGKPPAYLVPAKPAEENTKPAEEKTEPAEEPAAENTEGVIEYTGMGQKTIENVNIPKGPYYCELYHTGIGNSVNVVLHYGDNQKFSLNKSLDNGSSYAGRSCLKSSMEITDGWIEVKASGNWRIKFIPVEEKTTLNIRGTGDMTTGAFKAEKEEYNVLFKYVGKHNFIVKLYDITGDKNKLAVNEIGNYDETKKITLTVGHEYLFEVQADVNGGWNIDFGVKDEKPTTYSSSTLIKKELMRKDEQKVNS
ncbi:MAG: copper amine oxidase N-terminal domain-containing protein [Firmicutes bacterium]|nr:copper amine oxidase N-terminal domain-containing protein [Bacillota bacterium]